MYFVYEIHILTTTTCNYNLCSVSDYKFQLYCIKGNLRKKTICLIFHSDVIHTAGPSPKSRLKHQERLDYLQQSYLSCFRIVKEQQFTSVVSKKSPVVRKTACSATQTSY